MINAIENQTISTDITNEDTISHGKIYLKHAEYDKDRDDINSDDYNSYEEYATALEEETPGIPYDSIEILANSWVRCVNEVRGERDYSFKNEEVIKKFIDIYPLDAIEKIQDSTTRTRELDE